MEVKCKICRSATSTFEDPQFRLKYHYCDACEFLFKDDAAIVSALEEKAEYDLHNNTYEDEGYLNMFRSFINKGVMPYASEGRAALDFGSGPEPVLARLLSEEYGYKTDIYDLYYSPKKVYLGKSYDLITCTEVVEHLKDPLEYFQLFGELLKERGILSIMTHFHHNDQAKFLSWYYRREKTHISFFTAKTLEYIAKQVDLKPVYCDDKKCCTMKKSSR